MFDIDTTFFERIDSHENPKSWDFLQQMDVL